MLVKAPVILDLLELGTSERTYSPILLEKVFSESVAPILLR